MLAASHCRQITRSKVPQSRRPSGPADWPAGCGAANGTLARSAERAVRHADGTAARGRGAALTASCSRGRCAGRRASCSPGAIRILARAPPVRTAPCCPVRSRWCRPDASGSW